MKVRYEKRETKQRTNGRDVKAGAAALVVGAVLVAGGCTKGRQTAKPSAAQQMAGHKAEPEKLKPFEEVERVCSVGNATVWKNGEVKTLSGTEIAIYKRLNRGVITVTMQGENAIRTDFIGFNNTFVLLDPSWRLGDDKDTVRVNRGTTVYVCPGRVQPADKKQTKVIIHEQMDVDNITVTVQLDKTQAEKMERKKELMKQLSKIREAQRKTNSDLEALEDELKRLNGE